MLASFELENLVGPVYSQGNLVFSKNKNVLFSPIANRVKVVNLENNTSQTLPFESRSDISLLILSPDSKIMVIIDVNGYALIVNLISQLVISHFNFKGKVKDGKFSPDGKFLAICQGVSFRIYEAPSIYRQFESLILYKKFGNSHSNDIVTLQWSPDSRFLITAGKDLTVQLHNVFKLQDYNVITFSANKEVVKKCFFSSDMKFMYTIDKNSVLCIWKWVTDYVSDEYKKIQNYKKFKSSKKIKINEKEEKLIFQEKQDQAEQDNQENKDENKQTNEKAENPVQQNEKDFFSPFEQQIVKGGRFILAKKHKFYQKQFSKLKSCEYHQGLSLLILGYKHSNYTLHKIQDDQIADIQEITVSSHKISSICINDSGAWIGFGLKEAGQIMVWEWRSQSYILNQQCQGSDITSCAYSNDGRVIATGGYDGKLRLWDTSSYLCFSVIDAHDSKITGIVFTSKAKTILTSSLDGSVKAFDVNKFRCFRTLKSDQPAQFSCVAVDSAGEIACAGAMDPYEIYLWNIQTGNLIDVISGHTAPITCLKFSAIENVLFSGSVDKTVRIHDVFSRKTNTDILDHNSEITAIAVRNDGKEAVISTLKGELYIWDPKNANIIGNIDARRDLYGGRLNNERQTAQTSSRNKHFRSIEYSSDGEYILAGGNAKNLCLYELKHRVMLKKFQFTNNRSLDGVLDKLNSGNLVNGVVKEDEIESDSDYDNRKDDSLPGAKQYNALSKRRVKLAVECREIKFSPSDDSFSIATSEGLVVYSKNKKGIFTPFELESEITLETIQNELNQKNYPQALNMALKLNNKVLLNQIYLGIPKQDIFNCVKSIDIKFLNSFISFVSTQLQENNSIELHLIWLETILYEFSDHLKQMDIQSQSNLKSLLKNFGERFEQINKVTQQNLYSIDFLIANMKTVQKKAQLL
ncbi:WD40-repeat-containing domain [Pseudocohnilembus persalinus]|uniref:WD40-repeat-containing domain n=1 Tax=Pseudocohnilembus persalinus TaxID=266149 RepID=A0A0V0QHF7_PSEPJ|nr:WD40-repeat-containing domain [Pseudocohnilembus persalinus]|eukprot:KRX01618.1 WD40-repeat-containing domain [Pseudocohnilembus persalinus]